MQVCIFAGSHTGKHPIYQDATRCLATALVQRRIPIVYGGGSGGLMGTLADTVLQLNGTIIGITPTGLWTQQEDHHHHTQIHQVQSLATRKALMIELSDGFIVLPGGLGSLDEFFEVTCLAALHTHVKPIYVLNVNNFYTPLQEMLLHLCREEFIPSLPCVFFRDVPSLIEHIETHQDSCKMTT